MYTLSLSLSHTLTHSLSLSYTHTRAHVYDIKCLIVHTRTHAHTHAHNTKRRAPYIDMDHARVRNPGPEPHRRVGRQQLLVQHVHKLAKPVKPFRKRVPRLNCVKLAFIISRVVEIARTSAYKFHKRKVRPRERTRMGVPQTPRYTLREGPPSGGSRVTKCRWDRECRRDSMPVRYQTYICNRSRLGSTTGARRQVVAARRWILGSWRCCPRALRRPTLPTPFQSRQTLNRTGRRSPQACERNTVELPRSWTRLNAGVPRALASAPESLASLAATLNFRQPFSVEVQSQQSQGDLP